MVNKTGKRIAIVVIVLTLLGAAGLGVWAATPLDEILSPTPEATSIPTTIVVNVLTASGRDSCEFAVKPPTAGWRLQYGFQNPGTSGKLMEIPGDTVIEEVTVAFPLRYSNLPLEAGIQRKFRIDGAAWQYSVRPPDDTPINETFLTQPPESAGSSQSFRLQACRG